LKKFGGRRVSPLASPRWVSISTSRASCAAGWLATARSCTCRLIVEAEAASLSSNKAAKHHEGSDRVSWSQLAISRAVAVESSRGWRITKEKQAHKIDMVVALGMAALAAVKAQSEHTYNWRGDWISGPRRPTRLAAALPSDGRLGGGDDRWEDVVASERGRKLQLIAIAVVVQLQHGRTCRG
jgi:hypothetical protein